MTGQIYVAGCPWVAKRREKKQQKKTDVLGGANGDREKGADIPQMGQRM